jgi:hypothetical protein
MKKFDNIVVQAKDPEHNNKVIDTFVKMGYENLIERDGKSQKGSLYYGTVNGELDLWFRYELEENTKVITLEELKKLAEPKKKKCYIVTAEYLWYYGQFVVFATSKKKARKEVEIRYSFSSNYRITVEKTKPIKAK